MNAETPTGLDAAVLASALAHGRTRVAGSGLPEGGAVSARAVRSRPGRTRSTGFDAAGAREQTLELAHVTLAALTGEGGGEHDDAHVFEVEAIRDGTFGRWVGRDWVSILAGTAVLAPGDRIQWTAAAGASVPSSFIVRRVAADGSQPPPEAARPAFLVAVGEDGRAENVMANAGTREQVQVAAALLESRMEVRRLSNLLVSLQEDLRRRIALDLHDGLGQSLTQIKLSIEHSTRLLAAGASGDAHDALRGLVPRVQDALADVRRVSTELRPVILDDLGLLPALTWFVRELHAGSGIRVESVLGVSEQQVPARLHITIFRIVQEALHNIVKHAGASRVCLRMERSSRMLKLLIEDDGDGFDPACVCADARGNAGLGLLSMRERAYVSGGTYTLRSARGRGTRISVSWPCDAAL